MTQEDVDRIENEKAIAKLRAELAKAEAEAKKATDEKIAEPIEFKEEEDLTPPAGSPEDPANPGGSSEETNPPVE